MSTPVNGAIGRTGAARNSAVGGTRNSQTINFGGIQFKVQGTTYKVQMLHRLSAGNEKLTAIAKQLNAYIISR